MRQVFFNFFQLIQNPIVIGCVVLGNFIMFICAYLFLLFEQAVNENVQNYGDALWWAISTVSTVGYGDIVPVTAGGRITAVFLIILGVMFFLSFMAVVSSFIFTHLRAEEFHK